MVVSFINGKFVCVGITPPQRDIPDKANFRWDRTRKLWYTPDPRVAARLRSFADENARKEIDRTILRKEPWAGPLPTPPGMELLDFQKSAAFFLLSRNRAYAALDPGLGKTPTSIVVMNALRAKSAPKRNPVFIFISPPSLLLNAENEFLKWRTFNSVPTIYNFEELFLLHSDVAIVPDSLLIRPEVQKDFRRYSEKMKAEGREIVLFVDEAHRFNNWESQRTEALLGTEIGLKLRDESKRVPAIVDIADRVYPLSGTPMPARPIELYPILRKLAPETIDFGTKVGFGTEYCEAYNNGFGMVYRGAREDQVKNLAKKVIGTFMIRYKKDKLNLPPVTEEIVVLSENMPSEIAEMDREVLKRYHIDDLMKGIIHLKVYGDDADEAGDLHLMTYRKLLGIAKVPVASRFIIDEILKEQDPERGTLVFGIHTEALEKMAEALKAFNPILITGKNTKRPEERFTLMKKFQENKSHGVVVANMRAAGVGLNATRADRVVIFEPDWTPSTNDQARDRAHRYGQVNSVHTQYLVYKNSVDKKVMDTVLKKRQLTQHI